MKNPKFRLLFCTIKRLAHIETEHNVYLTSLLNDQDTNASQEAIGPLEQKSTVLGVYSNLKKKGS